MLPLHHALLALLPINELEKLGYEWHVGGGCQRWDEMGSIGLKLGWQTWRERAAVVASAVLWPGLAASTALWSPDLSEQDKT